MIVKLKRLMASGMTGKKRAGQDREAFRLLARVFARHHIARSSIRESSNDQVDDEVYDQKSPLKKNQKPDNKRSTGTQEAETNERPD